MKSVFFSHQAKEKNLIYFYAMNNFSPNFKNFNLILKSKHEKKSRSAGLVYNQESNLAIENKFY